MPGGGRSVAGMAFSRAKLVGAGLDAATRPRKIWHEIVAEKPTFPYLIPLLLLAWWIERFIVSFSNWVPLLAAVWATLQYGKYQHKLAVEKLNNKWHQHMLYNSIIVVDGTWYATPVGLLLHADLSLLHVGAGLSQQFSVLPDGSGRAGNVNAGWSRSAKIRPFRPLWCNSNGVTPIAGCTEVL
ncbi:hypothetical protein CBR_g27924 [Chara braunii]|uniref:Uncharacterized protein n=1 Tax=Chara braunii TaxID=69332 RepID=A0A388L8Q6_CHABU|nr:hypothetical protein CBR_g27924 [Chara braunii]|eukprot:GBG78699.1 hypothetical protein CBR_g27924 [Chara braunii]